MEDEPLEQWAARREERRPRPGERQAVPLGEQPHGAHVAPDAPRGIQEWDGHQWAPAGVAEDRAAATDETSGEDAVNRAERVPLPQLGKLPTMPQPFRPTVPWHRPDTS
ncbi:DUF6087 family protein [Streptomyces pilosus]|uniref:Uncharacterized protein n=1 Tax=Streptomyces pilosus TaxID=28893 RepID=A0A918C7I2_9ACTN|nr:DUF6087 family protein [Streptomyces pilosus]GGR09827.1 hypothetical protein GCM10010280_66940 [Streptomyces pilosus]